MILISHTEALFLPEDSKVLREEWASEMRSKGFQVLGLVCTNMHPNLEEFASDLVEQIRLPSDRIKELVYA